MKDGWKEVRLGDIIKKLPKSNYGAKAAMESGEYPFFTNSASEKKFYIDKYDYDEPIILANTGGKAYFKYCDTKCSASRDLYIFTCINGIVTKLLYYMLRQRTAEINENGFAGAALKHLNKEYLHNLKFVIPESIDEQNRLVKILEDFDSLADIHQSKAEILTRMKSQLMSNKTGIIERERKRSEQLQDIEHKMIDITNRLPKQFKVDNLERTQKIINIFTYVGEDDLNGNAERESRIIA